MYLDYFQYIHSWKLYKGISVSFTKVKLSLIWLGDHSVNLV